MKAMIATCDGIDRGTSIAGRAPMPTYPGIPGRPGQGGVAFDLAQVKSDGEALKRLLADDYLLINSQDKREDKAQFIADYTAGLHDEAVRDRRSGDQGVERRRGARAAPSTMKGMSDGKPYSVRIALLRRLGETRRQVAGDLHPCEPRRSQA